MSQAFALLIKGIKCDAPGCDYFDDTADISDMEAWLKVPCPKCGTPLLTTEDMAAIKAMQAMVEWGNAVSGDIPEDGEYVPIISLDMDGTGSVSIKDDPAC